MLRSATTPEKWDVWPCAHDCTGFFKIAPRWLRHLVPDELELDLIEGLAHFEVGYARFRPSHGLDAFEELSWGIAVKRKEGSGFAFYSPMLASNSRGFLEYNRDIGFSVYPEPVKFDVDLDRQSFAVSDERGKPIVVLRHQPESAFTLPTFLKSFFLKPTEVWTGTSGKLQRRIFDWRGTARVYESGPVASTLRPHPFFCDAEVDRAEPVPYEMFSSTRIARARQFFTFPRERAVRGQSSGFSAKFRTSV